MNSYQPIDNLDGSRSYIKEYEKLTELDQVDLIQNSLVKTYSTYCCLCHKSRSSGMKPVDFSIKMFEEGWSADAPYKIYCPECTKKKNS